MSVSDFASLIAMLFAGGMFLLALLNYISKDKK